MERFGKLLVSFYPGEAFGYYSEGEGEIRAIAMALGGFFERVFDMYLEFSQMADEGWLVRDERLFGQRGMVVSFYYPTGMPVAAGRQQIINRLLYTYLDSPVYPRPGIYVVQYKKNYKLIYRYQTKMQNRA